jgi:hypothetical protein
MPNTTRVLRAARAGKSDRRQPERERELRRGLLMASDKHANIRLSPDELDENEQKDAGKPAPIDEDVKGELNAALPDAVDEDESSQRPG